METSIAILILMLILSAFFSGSEMAFLSSNKLLLEINRTRHPRISRIIDTFYKNQSTLIATILVGNNVTMVIFSLVFSDMYGVLIDGYISSQSLILLTQTLISTLIIIVTAEFLPKNIIQLNPSSALNLAAIPLFFFYILFYPLGVVMQAAASFVIRHLFHTPQEEQSENALLSRIDFDNLVTKQAELVSDPDSDVGLEARLMRNTLDFNKVKVRDCYVPRTDIVAISSDDSIENLYKKFVETGYSKILIYKGSIDNIIGYVHVSEMFKDAQLIRNVMRPIAVVPETMRANMLLRQFTSQHKSIAIVVDEFGGTAGLITLEDVLEEIFGEINDEHDEDDMMDKQVDHSTFIFSGRMEVEDINEKYGLKLPLNDDYDTIAGLILSETQAIPKVNDVIMIDNFEFKILVAGHATIDKVLLSVH